MSGLKKTRGDVFITIRSRDLISTSIGDFNNSGRFNLFENIVATQNEMLGCELVSATIPNSFYNLSSNNQNNTISFKEINDPSYKILTIPSGSYDILELSTEIKTLLDTNSTNGITYTFTYNEITNQITITNSNINIITDFDFTTATTCRRFLGFTNSIKTINSLAGITSDRTVDITDTRNSIFIRLPNLTNNKIIESSNGKYSNCIAQVPVVLSRNTFFTFEPPRPFVMELAQKQINSIDILITYQEQENAVNFERADWEINLIISFFEIPHHNTRRKEEYNLSSMLEKKVREYQMKQINDLNKKNKLTDFVNANNLNIVKTNN